MSWLPASLGGRLLLALLLAAAAIAALIVALPATPLRAAAAAGATAGDPEPLSLPALPQQSLPVWLCAAAHQVPPTAAPVLEIRSDGSVLLRRPQPAALPALTAAAPAVILPAASLRGLSARQRGSLCECLAALLSARPVATTDVRCLGVQASSEEWRALLAWVQ